MLQAHSPEKENRSPANRKHKQLKEIRTQQQLLQFLASSHLTLSPDFQIPSQPMPNEIKLISSIPCDDEKAQMRVQLADLQFQLKKISQDFAEFKLLSKMDKDKTVRKLKEQLEEQRTKNSEESMKWQKKFSETSQQYEEQYQNFRVQLEKYLRAQQEERVQLIEQQHANILQSLRRQLDTALICKEKQLSNLQEVYRTQIADLTQHYENEIANLRKNEEAKARRKEEEMAQKIIVLQKEKTTEIKIIQESKKESCKMQEKYLYQIGLLERERRKLQQKVDQLEMKVKVHAKRFEEQTKAIEQLRRDHQHVLLRVEREKEEGLATAQELLSLQKSSFLEQQYLHIEQLEQRMHRLAESKQQVESNYYGLLRSLEQRFQRRESKRQDVEALRMFEEKLVSKQRENSHIYHQLRLIRLEKQNDEKLYTKIFSSAKKDKKSLSTRPEQDITTLLRQSRTTDIRQPIRPSQK